MDSRSSKSISSRLLFIAVVLCLVLLVTAQNAFARNPYRKEFFKAYPSANGSVLDDVPSHAGHCGVCHFDFGGGGTRNPYGLAVEGTPNRDKDDILSLDGLDSDGDGFNNGTEITDTSTYVNTPTFPGLKPANLSQVTNVDTADIQSHLVPSTGGDTTPPDVTVIAPDGGETLVGNQAATVQWIAGDAGGIAGIDIYVSLDNGSTYDPVALGLSNTGTYEWYPANRPTTQALILVVAIDNSFNEGSDTSDAVFTIESPPGGDAPTTLRDFDQPGSQPHEAGILNPPAACAVCHGDYDPNVEPFRNWQGSMMAQASLDPLFKALMVVSNQNAPDSGDLCLRCHLPRGWLQGRSVPTDGSQMLDTDASGVACDLCHRLIDPYFDPAANPAQDEGILAGLVDPPDDVANGMYIVDPTGARRGPFLNANTGHPVLVSPFHREAALCGTCHDVSNPAFEKDPSGNYVPNAFDAPAVDFASDVLAPVERTYSEWFHSAYNSQDGVYAPQFGGNKDYVATCQDCHMRDVTGYGCNFGTPPLRTDLPLHDQTGGNTWMPAVLSAIYPNDVNGAVMQTGITRARYMLQNAADMNVAQVGSDLKVTLTNNTGHKLPTGYPEGRRMWINVKFYDGANHLISESGAYDVNSAVLTKDAEVKIYEVKPGLDSITAPLVGKPEGPSFHFVLNNKIYKDNRIPPRGFANAAFVAFGGAPVAYSYADGQYWDDTYYAIPPGAARAEVTLYYQSTSKEFIEFLRDENTTDTTGQDMYDIWVDNGKSPPEVMTSAQIDLIVAGPATDLSGDGFVNFVDYSMFAGYWRNDCGSQPCGGANFDDSNQAIDEGDLAVLAWDWLFGY